jgi:addiction module HigA family antidote
MHNPPHPGEFITDVYLIPNNLSGRGLAGKLGVAASTLNRLLTGSGGISPEMALRLSKALGRSPEPYFPRRCNPPAIRLSYVAMLSFDIRTLESVAAQVDGDLPADDPIWTAADTRPLDAVHVEGRFSSAGSGRFYFSGRFSGAVKLECRKCLTDVTREVSEEVHFLFAPSGDTTTEDDPDVFTYDPGARQIDVRPAVREGWLLSVPAFAECREDCKGLCLTCGANLNEGPCNCEPATSDARWDSLRHARNDFQA